MRCSFYKTILSAVCLVIFPAVPDCQEQTKEAEAGIFELLAHHEIAEIELQVDMDSLMGRTKLDVYTHGRFTFEREKKQSLSIPVNIKARGKFRRMKCSFPPLKLKFKKNDLTAHGMNDFNELKLVTHCLDEKEISKELILREYLVYKLFNLLTPNSFRVQLVKVTYVDTGRKNKKLKGWGIVIEDEQNLAHRLGGKKVDAMNTPVDSLDAAQEHLVSMFQYMIGNSDWSVKLNRNIQLLLVPSGKILVIPYDFDYSGVVAAPYARVDVSLGQKRIGDRVFMGYADSVEELKPTIDYLLSKEEAVLDVIHTCPQLMAGTKYTIEKYLLTFFDLLEDEVKVANEVLATRKKP